MEGFYCVEINDKTYVLRLVVDKRDKERRYKVIEVLYHEEDADWKHYFNYEDFEESLDKLLLTGTITGWHKV